MDDIADGLRTALTESLSSLQLNVNGQTFTPMTLMQQGNTDQAIEGILSSLTGREPVERLPVSDLSDFTVLDNGLVIQCHAEERLSPGFTIANPTSQPLEFDPTGFVAESRRNTQRLTVPFLTDNVSIRVEAPGFSSNIELESFVERIAKDFGHFMLDKSLSNPGRTTQGLVVDPANHLGSHLRKISTPVGAVWSHMMERELFGKVVKRIISTPAYARLRTEASWVQFIGEMTGRDFVLAARGGAEFLPVVGNMLSLYEAYYGHPLLEPDNRSSLPERGLALIGTIPGGRVATKGVEGAVRATETLADKARKMIDDYTNSRFVRGLEASEIYRDIAWWGLSNAHQELAIAVDDHFDTGMTNEWRETIDYIKSL